jgi:hypothetical protein
MKGFSFLLAVVAAIGLLPLAGCDLSEHERLLHLGKDRKMLVQNTPLNEEQLSALRERVGYQALPTGDHVASITYTGSHVRPPGAPLSDTPSPAASKP